MTKEDGQQSDDSKTPKAHDHVHLIHGFSQGPLARFVTDYLAIGLSQAERRFQIDTLRRKLLEYVSWHPQTTIPSQESLRNLGMEFLLEDVPAFQVPPA